MLILRVPAVIPVYGEGATDVGRGGFHVDPVVD